MTSQNHRNRRRGAQFEMDVLRYVREKAGLPAERLRLAGKDDEGDVAVQDVGMVYVFEVKNAQKFDLSGWVGEAKREAANYARARGLDPATVMPVVVVKRRGKGTGEAFVVTTLDEFLTA